MSEHFDFRDDPERQITSGPSDAIPRELSFLRLLNPGGLTYWYDKATKKAVGVVTVPDIESLSGLHSQIFGEIPHRVFELETDCLRFLLQKIEQEEFNGQSSHPVEPNPYFQIILFRDFTIRNLRLKEIESLRNSILDYMALSNKAVKQFRGQKIMNSGYSDYFVFNSVAQAILCVERLTREFAQCLSKPMAQKVTLKMGLGCTTEPYHEKIRSEKSLRSNRRLAYISRNKTIISPKLSEICRKEAPELLLPDGIFLSIDEEEERFIHHLFDFMDLNWQKENLHVDDLCKSLNYSKSQFYRKLVALTGLSPNTFIKEYRLDRSIELLHSKQSNIAEIAYESGFSSPSYFTKCFQKHFGLTPSVYMDFLFS